jgi:nitroreductase
MDVLEALRQRRTVRQYVPDYIIPKDILTQLIDLVLDAPTGRNQQELDLVVITSRPKIDEISAIALEGFDATRKGYFSARTTELGVTNVVTCDASALIFLVGNERGESQFAQIDAGIMLMTLMAAAPRFGLGTMCLGALLHGDKSKIEAAAGVAPGGLVMAIALGKPKEGIKFAEKKKLAKATIVD